MIRTLVLCCVLAWPSLLLAQVARVQTGEHASFTRVVVTMPVGTDWQLGRDARGYALRLPGIAGYDLAGFFELIPQDRIADASAAGEVLSLAVVCPCNADAFLFRPDILVIDIRDGLPRAGAPFEQVLDVPVPIARSAVPAEPVTASSTAPAAATPLFRVPSDPLLPIIIPRSTPPVETAPDLATVAQEDPVPPQPDPAETEAALSALEEAIARSLAQGLSEGALDGAAPERGASAGSTRDIAAAVEALDLPGVEARTGVDALAVPGAAPPDVTQEGDLCLPDSYFAVPTWGTDAPFFDQINLARRALVGEFDVVDSEAVTALAQRYLYFGFGREAQRTLSLDDVQSQERRYLTALAQIIDQDPLLPDQFVRQVSCPGPVAMWAVLADTAPPFDAQVNRAAVLTHFKALPVGLQKLLGPRLSNQFLSIGDADAAFQVMTPVQAQAVPPVEAALAEANLQEALGEEEAALATVTEIAREEPRATPEALTRFFDNGVASGVAFTDQDFVNADALRFEVGDGPAVTAMTIAQVSAYLSVDRLTDAASLLEEATQLIPEEDASRLGDELLLAATARLSNGAFLEFVWGVDVAARGPHVQNAVAARLLELGFVPQAAELLASEVTEDAATERRYLRAQAALLGGDAAAAVAGLAPLNSDRAAQLRAAALAQLEAETMVAQISDGLSSVPAEDALGLLGPEGSDGVLDDVAVAVQQQEPAALNPDTPLTQSRDLLERSAQSRALLDDLLRRYATPDDL